MFLALSLKVYFDPDFTYLDSLSLIDSITYRIMAAHRIFKKNALLLLTNNQAFVYGCFTFKSDYYGTSFIKQSDLARYCKCSTSKIQNYIKIFNENNLLVSITHYYKNAYGDPRRYNEYLLDVFNMEKEDCFVVYKNFFELDIPSKILGYVLLLKCLCEKDTNDCYYDLKEISAYIKVGYSTIKGNKGLHQQAINYGLIKDEEVEYHGKMQIRHQIITPYILTGENR